MKTWKKILLLVGILLLAFGVTVIKIARTRGESFLPAVSVGSSGSFGYDQRGYTVCTDGEESFAEKDVRSLSLDWISGSVSVERWDGKDVVVREEADRALKEDQCMRWKLSNGELSILPCANKVSNMPEKHLTVRVPQSLVLEGVGVDVSSADVKLSGIDAKGEISLESSSGRLYAEDCRCADMRLESSSGVQSVLRTELSGELRSSSSSGGFAAETLACRALDVDSTSGVQSYSDLRCDSLEISASSGKIRGTELRCCSIKSESSSGSVTLAFAAAPAGIEIETSSGDVELILPKGTGINLLFDSSSGKFGGELVRGDLPIDVETSSGDLTIEYR